ncbi:MAG: 4Fe-4S binding protein [Myxococcota bacterium]|nr:4Fe-4S binding protein [Myxococcota bacterium]
MAQLNYKAELDLEGCTGCNWCDIACPSGAITMSERKAYIDDQRCIGCGYCVDRCPEDVMWMTRRETPLELPVGLAIDEETREKAAALAEKAGVPLMSPMCPCAPMTTLPVAAAIVMGAQHLEDVSAMTGIRGGCKIYCVAPALRLLKAAGRDLTPPKGFRWYDLTLSMLDLEGSQLDGEAGSWLEEDLDYFQVRKDTQPEGSQS